MSDSSTSSLGACAGVVVGAGGVAAGGSCWFGGFETGAGGVLVSSVGFSLRLRGRSSSGSGRRGRLRFSVLLESLRTAQMEENRKRFCATATDTAPTHTADNTKREALMGYPIIAAFSRLFSIEKCQNCSSSGGRGVEMKLFAALWRESRISAACRKLRESCDRPSRARFLLSQLRLNCCRCTIRLCPRRWECPSEARWTRIWCVLPVSILTSSGVNFPVRRVNAALQPCSE